MKVSEVHFFIIAINYLIANHGHTTFLNNWRNFWQSFKSIRWKLTEIQRFKQSRALPWITTSSGPRVDRKTCDHRNSATNISIIFISMIFLDNEFLLIVYCTLMLVTYSCWIKFHKVSTRLNDVTAIYIWKKIENTIKKYHVFTFYLWK